MRSRNVNQSFEPLESRLLMASHMVSNLNDGGAGSLRQAVGVAVDGDEILVNVGGTLRLSAGPLQITKSITIRGGGADYFVIDASNRRAMTVVSGNVTIENLTFTRGLATDNGGAIVNFGNLTLNGVWFRQNIAAERGGAIYNFGTLNATSCYFNDNRAGGHGEVARGGAVYNAGTMSLQACSFFYNYATAGTGGDGMGLGGAVALDEGSATGLMNCTFDGNFARGATSTISTFAGGDAWGGAIGAFGGTGWLEVTNCTITRNYVVRGAGYSDGPPGSAGGGGAFFDIGGGFHAVIRNTVIAQNHANPLASAPNDLSGAYNVVSDGCNLIGTPEIRNGVPTLIDFSKHDRLIFDPMLGDLADNGGRTFSRRPLPGSPLIDGAAHSTVAVATDQNGRPRNDGAIDIGAVEHPGPPVAGYRHHLEVPRGIQSLPFGRLEGDITRQITIEARVRFSSAPVRNVIVSSGRSSLDQSITLEYDPGAAAFKFLLRDTKGGTIVNLVAPMASSQVLNNKWIAVVAHFHGPTGLAEISVDGRVIGQTYSDNLNPVGYDTEQMGVIGGITSQRMFDGAIDDLRIWNISRGALPSGAVDVNHPNLLAAWNFDEPNGSPYAYNAASWSGAIPVDSSWDPGTTFAPTDAPVRFYVRDHAAILPPGYDPDIEGLPLAVEVVTPPTKGRLEVPYPSAVWFNYFANEGATGTDTFTYRVQGADGGWSEPMTASVHITPYPAPPVITSASPPDANAYQPYSFVFTAADVNGDPLSFSATLSHEWMTFTDNGDGTATISGTPTNDDAGVATVSVVLSDGITQVPHQVTFNVAANAAPTFTATPAPIWLAPGESFSYTFAATDAEGDPVSFTPGLYMTGLSFVDHGDGTATFSGNPSPSTGMHLIVYVSDGYSTVSQTLSVGVNHAPTFTSTAPATIAYFDTTYSHTIGATDADGDALAITATGLPSWLKLVDHGNQTATLSGVPTDSLASSHAITLRVSDGATFTEQSFTLSVPMERFRLDAQGTLTVMGGIGRDVIQVWVREGNQVRAVVNGVIRNYPLSAITGLTIYGLDENDSISVNTRTIPAYVLGGGGNDTITGGDQRDFLIGGGGHDRLYAGAGDDRLSGLGGNDYLEGGSGQDVLTGGDGHDYLVGNSGMDRFYGDGGNDTLIARDLGYDILHGGDGDDLATYDANDLLHELFATPA